MTGVMIFGYFLVSHRKSAGTPMAAVEDVIRVGRCFALRQWKSDTSRWSEREGSGVLDAMHDSLVGRRATDEAVSRENGLRVVTHAQLSKYCPATR